MMFNTHPPLPQGAGSQNVPMANHDREVIYGNGYTLGEETDPPTITRYHRGAWHPGHRQYIFGSESFSGWQSMHGTHTRETPRDRTNLNRAKAKPIRLWDRGAYPQSVPPKVFTANPSQQMVGNTDASGYQLPLTAQGY